LAKKKERIKRLGSEIRKIKNKGLQRVVTKTNKERLCKKKKIYIYIYIYIGESTVKKEIIYQEKTIN